MTACAIGKFDALHRGHFALVERAAQLGQPCVVTFSGMAAVLGWDQRAPLVAPADRERVLQMWSQRLGKTIQVEEIPFADVRNMEPATFVDYLRDHLHASAVIVGEDFRFGRNRSGDVQQLQQLLAHHNAQADIVAPVCYNDVIISSSRIRDLIAQGNVAEAHTLLDRPYRLLGSVIHGEGRGKKIGFPTANIGNIHNEIPGIGVYAAWASIDKETIPAAVNIGHLPTISGDRPLTVEAHLLNWSGNCYDSPIAIDFIDRVRGEHRFATLDALVAQIEADCSTVRHLLGVP